MFRNRRSILEVELEATQDLLGVRAVLFGDGGRGDPLVQGTFRCEENVERQALEYRAGDEGDRIDSGSRREAGARPRQMNLRVALDVAAILSAQYWELVAGGEWWSGHPCQKHPSTKTAIRVLRSTRSAVRASSGWGRADTRNRIPRRCTAERTANSGFVSRLRLPCIDLRVADDEAQDSFPEPAPTIAP